MILHAHRGLYPTRNDMIKNLASFSLVLAPLVCITSSYQYVTTKECDFTFNNGELPSFVVPKAGPNSPGDVQLNVGNNMITRGRDEADGGLMGGWEGVEGKRGLVFRFCVLPQNMHGLCLCTSWWSPVVTRVDQQPCPM